MPSIDPKTSVMLNIGAALLLGLLAYVGKEGLPEPWPPEWSHVVAVQAKWIGGALAVVVSVLNAYLHSVSSDKPGPLAK